MGGVLKVATIGEPPTLDMPMSTATLTYEIMWHVNETLFTYDAGFNRCRCSPSPTPSPTGLRHTITLRKGVKFHNGKEMTAADVVPSFKRWGRSPRSASRCGERREHRGARPVHGRPSLKQPSASLLFGLAEPHGAIYPKESHRGRRRGPAEGVHRHRALPLHRAPARPPHQARPLQGVRGAERAGQRVRRQARGLLRRDPVHPGARHRGAPGRRGDGRVSTTRCSSSRTPTTASSRCPRSTRASSSRAAGRWRC